MAGGIRDDGDDDDLALQHDINITPFIDVMLVLLIIFMVAAPLSTVDVPVRLPVASAKPQPRPDKPIYITLKADLTLAVGEDDVAREALIRRVHEATGRNRDTRLYVRADKSVPYGELMKVMNIIGAAGYTKVGLVAMEGAALSP